MHILLVEDEPKSGDYLRRGLTESGFVVDWVRNGISANHVLASDTFDAMLLDIGLPQKDDFSVLKAMRQRQDATPAIVITARD